MTRVRLQLQVAHNISSSKYVSEATSKQVTPLRLQKILLSVLYRQKSTASTTRGKMRPVFAVVVCSATHKK